MRNLVASAVDAVVPAHDVDEQLDSAWGRFAGMWRASADIGRTVSLEEAAGPGRECLAVLVQAAAAAAEELVPGSTTKRNVAALAERGEIASALGCSGDHVRPARCAAALAVIASACALGPNTAAERVRWALAAEAYARFALAVVSAGN
jgi:hypothetical protein